ncbi:hypothetical protein BMS3Bbin13_00003 [bacterium BMS3Bbin13]|nr:hypothetical protein BMS3Bbin13_00003 [bacterium BMS3Bbin13]
MSVIDALEKPGLRERVFAGPPHWANDRIEPFDEEGFRLAQPFVIEQYWSGQQSINVFDVVGTQHPDYAGRSWLEFLREGKRMGINLDLQRENPDYYLEDRPKLPGMYYRSVDGSRWFVAEDGNHRTAIARFMFHEMGRSMLHGVTVIKYKTDQRAMEVAAAVSGLVDERGLRVRLETCRTKLSREDTGGWMREEWRLDFEWTDLRRGVSERLAVEEVERRVEALRRQSRWRGWMGWFRRSGPHHE